MKKDRLCGSSKVFSLLTIPMVSPWSYVLHAKHAPFRSYLSGLAVRIVKSWGKADIESLHESQEKESACLARSRVFFDGSWCWRTGPVPVRPVHSGLSPTLQYANSCSREEPINSRSGIYTILESREMSIFRFQMYATAWARA
jgi:hypothetical protein